MFYPILLLIITISVVAVLCIPRLKAKKTRGKWFAAQNQITELKSVVVPTIYNEQSYYYFQAKYKTISFIQLLRSNDYISNVIKRQGKWPECEEMYDLYLASSKKGIFIDFGANIGSCSFLFAQAGVKVYAFEPLPNNLFPFTVTTFGNKNFTKYITIYPYALGKEEKNLTMKITKDNWSFSSVYYNHTDYIETIPVKRLDDFDKLVPTPVSLIKIDVEAAEYDLIEGGKEFFKNHITEYIHMEADCGRMINGKYEIERLFKILDDMGYNVIRKFDCKKITKSNIVAKRKGL